MLTKNTISNSKIKRTLVLLLGILVAILLSINSGIINLSELESSNYLMEYFSKNRLYAFVENISELKENADTSVNMISKLKDLFK